MEEVSPIPYRPARSHAIVAWRSRPLVAALGVALASRLAIAVSAFATLHLFTVGHVSSHLREPALAETFRGSWGALLNPFAHYDGVWFLRATVEGYSKAGTPAFFPLYPLAVRLAGELVGHRYELGALVVSTLCFLAGAWLLFQLVAADFGPRPAVLTVVFLSLFPTSFFFQAAYSESLFLLLSVVFFWFLRREQFAAAGLCGLLCALTRMTGLVLLVPLMMAYFRQGRTDGRSGLRPLVLLLPLLGLLLYCAWLWHAVGDPVAWARAEAAWERHLTLPTATLWGAAQGAWYGVRYAATGHGIPVLLVGPGESLAHVQRELAAVNIISFLALVFGVWALIVGWRRLPRTWTAYTGFSLLVPLVDAPSSAPLMSLPRFVLVLFPCFVTLALVTERRRVLRTTLLVLSTAALVYLTGRFALWLFVA